ncbi:hypothetical protein D0C36_17535 [Mucilaginibacter conchicola]|uniref:Uncharacterized protein n=1 Tax=Mucilaginibacter conchicola TaxID=2303333 RepID=A0A372NPG7_9SPHI|nr:hypothetical protein [Mucilaginibacter conchicola]RFZ90758.1 hypothetical protein D0C36_17535 [Mucilaginibacter conchicola]
MKNVIARYEAISLGWAYTLIKVSLLIAAGATSFVLIQKKQKIKSATRLLFVLGLTLQSDQNHGLQNLAATSFTQPPASGKYCYALTTAHGHHCSARFRPKLFCRQRKKKKE